MKKATFRLSIRCYYENGNHTQHFQDLRLSDIAKWVDSYKFTHPDCTAITVKLWFGDIEE